jgi:ribulose-bisphosphate carboxylase large chain
MFSYFREEAAASSRERLMKKEDLNAFYANIGDLDVQKYVIFHYYFESVIEPEEAAALLCREQSTAQWKRIGIQEDFRKGFGARVVRLEVRGTVDTFPYSTFAAKYRKSHACTVKIAHPHGNFGPRIPNLLTAAGGEGAFHSPGIAAIRLMDIDFPESFLRLFDGPKFGIEGFRDLLGVYDRPIFFGVVKPNLGLTPEQFAEEAYKSWLGGLDVAKDDEMLSDVPWSPLEKRVALLGKMRLQCEKIAGEKKIYLVNITDEVDRIIELHDIAVRGGANACMVNAMATGLSAVRVLRKHSRVPLVSHFDFLAPFTSMPNFGVHSKLITKLQRIAGIDVIIMPGFGERMKIPESEVMENVEECFRPMGHIKKSLPVPAGSQWAGTTESLYQKLGTVDFGIVPGRAVFEHPMGPEAGARALRQGWDAVQKGLSIEAYSADHIELEEAIRVYKA